MRVSILLAAVLVFPAGPAHAAVKRADLVVSSLTAAGPAAGTVTYTAVTANRGKAAAGASRLAAFLSTDLVRNKGDVKLDSHALPRLAPKRTRRTKSQVVLPAGLMAGAYHVIACADATSLVRERNERNNCRATRAVVQVPAVTPISPATSTFAVRGTPTPAEGGTVTASSASTGASCTGAECSVPPGAEVTLSATASTGYRFSGWSGDSGCNGEAAVLTLAPAGATTCQANFMRRVRVTATSGSGGSVALNSASAGSDCAAGTCTVDAGSNVSFTATPSAGFRFGGWTGPCTGQPAAFELAAVTTDVTCTASFTPVVTIAAGAGSGGAIQVSGLSGGTCSQSTCTLDSGAGSVTFTPAPTSHFRFGDWSGANCSGFSSGSDGSITFTNPTNDKSCTASFVATVLIQWEIVTGGGASGNVTVSGVTGGSCDSTARSCTLDSGAGTVTLTPQASTGSTEQGWTGNPDTCPFVGWKGPITFTNVTADAYCGAVFV